jgi:hypothetical protein
MTDITSPSAPASLIDGQSIEDFIRNSTQNLQRMSPAQERRIIQVTTDSTSVTVLCSDGSLWVLPEHGESKGRWKRLPPIPQEE